MKKIIIICIAALAVAAAAAALLLFLPGSEGTEGSAPDNTASKTDPPESASSQMSATNSSTENTSSAAQPPETPSAQDQPQEPVPENVLITSGDPQHYIRIEFNGNQVLFSGVYSGDRITTFATFSPRIESSDFSRNGDSFQGSVDISSLEPGYHIFEVWLESAAGMYYVFEKTADGSRAVPSDRLPAAANLAASNSPLELPDEGVLLHITTQGSERAAEVLDEIKSLSDQICEGITDDYDKARALAQWVSANMYYDKDAAERGVTDEEMTLDFILENHRSVCFGWSNLYSALCQAQGIDCFNASGSAVPGSRCFPQTDSSDERAHSWNMVVIGDRKIWVDTVWNSSNIYKDGDYKEYFTDMQFFDIDNALLANDHRVTRFEHRDYFNSGL